MAAQRPIDRRPADADFDCRIWAASIEPGRLGHYGLARVADREDQFPIPIPRTNGPADCPASSRGRQQKACRFSRPRLLNLARAH